MPDYLILNRRYGLYSVVLAKSRQIKMITLNCLKYRISFGMHQIRCNPYIAVHNYPKLWLSIAVHYNKKRQLQNITMVTTYQMEIIVVMWWELWFLLCQNCSVNYPDKAILIWNPLTKQGHKHHLVFFVPIFPPSIL